MTAVVSERVVATRSDDGFVLEGLLVEPNERSTTLVAVWVHGLYGAFYAPPGLAVGRVLAATGIPTVLGNNRGHNVGAWLRGADGQLALAGGAWERLADAAYDLRGWIDFAVGAAGADGVVLIGHSLGARKVAVYAAEAADPRLRAVACLSPSEAGIAVGREPFPALAEEMSREGRGYELLPVAPERALSAGAYAERLDPQSAMSAAFASDVRDPAIAAIAVPILLLLGENERRGVDSSRLELERIARGAVRSSCVDTHVVDGANHLFATCEAEAGQTIVDWMRRLGFLL